MSGHSPYILALVPIPRGYHFLGCKPCVFRQSNNLSNSGCVLTDFSYQDKAITGLPQCDTGNVYMLQHIMTGVNITSEQAAQLVEEASSGSKITD